MRFGIGQPVTRKEDRRFLIELARQTYAVFVYSPHAHARIRSIDTEAAARTHGVFAVLTADEWAANGLGTLDPGFMAEDVGGPPGFRTEHPPLARDRVRYVGEANGIARVRPSAM
jgi:carbon-monoxide dehydrogenase large subunit